jgi:SpoIID/LytB domain protein
MRRPLASIVAASALLTATVGVQTLTAVAVRAAGVTYYRPADGVLHLSGHGFGHGHGMSQWGAYGGAIAGNSYQQILAWYFNQPTFANAGGTIKVQITADGRNADGTYDVRLTPAVGLTAVDGAGHSLTLPTKNSAGTAYDAFRAVLLTNGGFRVQAHAGSSWTSLAPSAAGTTAGSWTKWVRFSARGGVLKLVRPDGSTERYRENLELDKTGSGAGMTVNRLSLEHYLLGVVSSEMPCSWTPTVNGTKRLDALESQAVAARSYAAWRRDHPRSSLADLVDNTYDQAYHGYSAEVSALSACPWTNSDGTKTSAEAAAVAATAGQVMVDGSGHAIFAQYSASNGGFETAGGQSYLPSRPDAWDGVPTDSWNSHSWTDTVTAGRIESAYSSIGHFMSLTVDSREQLSGVDQNGENTGEDWGGRITGMTLTGSAGSVSTTGAAFAGALGLESPWFTVDVTKPAAPGSVSAQPGDAQATLRWSAPSSDGGGGIRSYTISASPAITPITVPGSARSAVVTGLANDTAYVFSVAATNTAGTGSATSASPVTPSARVVFHPLPPTRALDTTRTGGAIGAHVTRAVTVTGVAGVPSSGVVDVVLDVAALNPTATSSLSVYPDGGPRPPTAQLSWTRGARLNALVPVKVGPNGKVDLRNNTSGSVQVYVDVQGYYTAASAGGGDVLTSVSAYKLFDSRGHAAVGRHATRTIPVVGRAGVPSGATAAVVQVTVVRPSRRDYVRVWGSGSARPAVYDLYAQARQYTSATAVVPLTSSGSIVVSPVYATHLVVTLEGWFAPAPSSGAVSGVTSLVTPPHRVLSVRLGAGATRTVSAQLPSGAAAAFVTVAAIGSGGSSVVVSSSGRTAPVASLWVYGSWLRMSQVAPLGSDGGLAVRNAGRRSVRVIVDVAGWA